MEMTTPPATPESDQIRQQDLITCRTSASHLPYWNEHAEEKLLDLATFRMVVLADELLEGFFGHDLASSFQLEKTDDEDYHQAHQKSDGLLGGLMNLVVTNE